MWHHGFRTNISLGGIMSRINQIMLTSIVAAALVASVAIAQESDQTTDQTAVESAESVANQAIAELAAWDNKEAKKILKKAKGKYGSTPAFQTAWALLEIQEAADDDQKSLDSFADLNKAGKIKSFEAAASYFEGEILYQNNQRDDAQKAWQMAADRAAEMIAADQDDATAQFYFGAASVRLKEFGDARKALKSALRNGFDSAMVHHQMGLSFLFQEKWDKAKEEFDTGLEIRPRYAPMYFWRAMAWDKLGRKDNMLIDLDMYVKLAPNGPDVGRAQAVLASTGG
jgi:tetratricopeptide (TPR) repeat protein